jgi:pimeloyl-ACP methyl ester carboxylesterase
MTMANRLRHPAEDDRMNAAGGAAWAALGHVVLRYVDTGAREGRPLLLLHEMGGTLESWLPVLPHLPQQRRIVLCDMRGAGGSEKIRAPASIDTFADDLVALLTHLGLTEPVDVAGVAIGGCLGLRIAAAHPDRVHRLVAINPPTDAIGRSGEVLRERAAKANELGMRGVVEAALGRSYPEHLRGDRRAYDDYVARFLCNDPTSYAYILRALSEVDFAGVLERVGCPTALISGRHDEVRRSADIQALVPRIRSSRFLEIEGGHIPNVQAPLAVAAALDAVFGGP